MEPRGRRRWTRWRKIRVFGGLALLAADGVFGGAFGRDTLLFIGAVWLYFAPAFIASWRQKPNVGAVMVINAFLGWTGIGWIVALAMACA